MSPTTAILAAILVPLIGAVFIVLNGRSANVRDAVTLITAIVTFGIVATLFDHGVLCVCA